MHPWPSCNGRTRNCVSMSICTRPHYFYCPSPDFTTSTVSVGNKQSLCPLMWGTREKWGGTPKNFRPALCAGIVPPTCKLVPTPLLSELYSALTRLPPTRHRKHSHRSIGAAQWARNPRRGLSVAVLKKAATLQENGTEWAQYVFRVIPASALTQSRTHNVVHCIILEEK